MNAQDLARLHATIEGRVQGVSFRYFVRENALRLGLVGWVRNRYNGSVEVLAEGPRAVLETFLTALQRGPSASNVTKVTENWDVAEGEFDRFKIRMTA